MGDVTGVLLVCRTLIEGVMIEALVILVLERSLERYLNLLAEKSGYHKWFRLQMSTSKLSMCLFIYLFSVKKISTGGTSSA